MSHFTPISPRPGSRAASFYGGLGSTNPSRANSYTASRNASRANSYVGYPHESRANSYIGHPNASRAHSYVEATRQGYSTPSSFANHTTAQGTPDNRSEKDQGAILGRIVGGRYHVGPEENHPHADYGPLQVLDFDMPLTLTELVRLPNPKYDEKTGGGENESQYNEYIVLNFANNDKVNPFNWSPYYKLFITALLCFMTLFIGLATTAYSSGIDSMVQDLNASPEEGQLGLFLFNIACAIAPMVLAPFCELVGRRVVYSGAYLCFSLLFIGLALGKNIETILVCRLLLGLFGCVGTILVGGTFDDMYEPQRRSRPMAFFAFIAIFGTVAAPVYAGFIDQSLGWRWIEGIQGLANIPLLCIIIIFFPETRGGVFLHQRAKILRDKLNDPRFVAADDITAPTLRAMLRSSSIKAIHMLVTEPVVFAFGLYIGFCWFLVFLFLSVIPITFSEKRGWSEGVSGLPYISLAIGTTLGWLAHHIQMRRYEKLVAKQEEEMQAGEDISRPVTPEDRLWGAQFGVWFLPVGLFIYSFTQYGHIPWIAPTIGLAPIAFGIFFVFESTYSYTADCYGTSAGSAIAGQGFVRNSLGAVTPLFASAFFHNVGSQYAGLILAVFGTVLSCIPVVAIRFGPMLRGRSKLAMEY